MGREEEELLKKYVMNHADLPVVHVCDIGGPEEDLRILGVRHVAIEQVFMIMGEIYRKNGELQDLITLYEMKTRKTFDEESFESEAEARSFLNHELKDLKWQTVILATMARP